MSVSFRNAEAGRGVSQDALHPGLHMPLTGSVPSSQRQASVHPSSSVSVADVPSGHSNVSHCFWHSSGHLSPSVSTGRYPGRQSITTVHGALQMSGQLSPSVSVGIRPTSHTMGSQSVHCAELSGMKPQFGMHADSDEHVQKFPHPRHFNGQTDGKATPAS